jgi:hypothetical protein
MPARRPPRSTPSPVRGWLTLLLAVIVAACARAPEPFIECVPYARETSGISIYGDAWTWWEGARGRYQRGQKPREGSVLALRRTDRLRLGHVAVVSRVIGPREIRLDHANWGNDSATRGRIYRSMPAIDVSAANDWTEVRFWNERAGVYGGVYPAHGFIHPFQDRAEGRPQLAGRAGWELGGSESTP